MPAVHDVPPEWRHIEIGKKFGLEHENGVAICVKTGQMSYTFVDDAKPHIITGDDRISDLRNSR